MLITLMGLLVIYLSNRYKIRGLYITGNLTIAFGCLLFLNELIIIILRWLLGIKDITFLEMVDWILNFTFVNTYPGVEIYLEILSISVAISVFLATTIVAKKIIRKNKANDKKIIEIEKKLEEMKKQ